MGERQSKYEEVGFVAAIMTTVAFWPQAIMTLSSRDVSGLSLATYTTYTIGLVLWLIFGLGEGTRPTIYSSIFSLIPAVVITYLIIRHKQEVRHEVFNETDTGKRRK